MHSAPTRIRISQQGQGAGKLSEADQISNRGGSVHEGGKPFGTGSAERAEENGASVVEENHRAADPENQERAINARGCLRSDGRRRIHGAE